MFQLRPLGSQPPLSKCLPGLASPPGPHFLRQTKHLDLAGGQHDLRLRNSQVPTGQLAERSSPKASSEVKLILLLTAEACVEPPQAAKEDSLHI